MDEITKAVKYISQEMLQNPNADKNKIINEASQKFDLNPLQTDFLINKFLLEK